MKKICAGISLLVVLIILCSSAVSASAYTYSMETKAFDVDINIMENNVYYVTTRIKVFFNTQKHGIYYYLPYKGEVSRMVDGEVITNPYRNSISDIKVENYKYETSYESGNIVFKIGDGEKYVTGEHTYVIRYKCTLRDDKITALDDVYWNIFPLDWESPIESGTVRIKMPKSFEPSEPDFTGGFYGENKTGLINYEINGLEIVGTLTRVLNIGEGVTVKLNLPEGYFVNEKTDAATYALMVFAMLGGLGIIFVLWFLVGRDEKIIPVVSFYPPKGMTSAETGYIVDGTIDTKDLVSLLLFWASKGYISLNQTEKNKFDIFKRRDLPANAKSYERTMFDGLFKNRNVVTTDELKNSFYITLDASKIMLKNHFSAVPENNIYTKKSTFARKLSSLLCVIPSAAFLLTGLYIKIAEDGWYIGAVLLILALMFCSKRFVSVFDKRHAMKKSSLTAAIILLSVIAGGAGAAVLAIGTFVIGQFVLASVAIGLTAVCVILTMRMKTRTPQSNRWMEEILGLKNFIEAAELDRINMLVEESPEYFYNVLPFAYVFGLTDKWAKKFESIAIRQPEWYTSSYPGMQMGYFNAIMFTNALSRGMSNVSSSMQIRPAPSGGGSGGGGGFSSGGGFSGGGMGGGGGGSW